MAFDINSYADRVTKANAFKNGVRFTDGIYTLVFKKGSVQESKNPQNRSAVWFNVEFVVDSCKPQFIAAEHLRKGEDPSLVKPNAEGTSATSTLDLNDDMMLGNIQKICAAIAQITDYNKDNPEHAAKVNAVMKKVANDDPSLHGVKVNMSTFRTFKKNGEIFVGSNWSAAAQTEEERATLAKMISDGKI